VTSRSIRPREVAADERAPTTRGCCPAT